MGDRPLLGTASTELTVVAMVGLVILRMFGLRANLRNFTFNLNIKGGLYFLIIGATVLGITARVSHPSAFYMLLPQWSLGILLGLLAVGTGRDLLSKNRVGSIALPFLIAGQALGFSAYFMPGGAGQRLLTGSRNLQESAAVIKTMAPLASTSALQINYVEVNRMDCVYYLLMGIFHEEWIVYQCIHL